MSELGSVINSCGIASSLGVIGRMMLKLTMVNVSIRYSTHQKLKKLDCP
jgi:hypothetical protein